MEAKLLTRDAFREGVFARDRNLCVNCQSPAQDAHHIIERRLFADGGYYLDNGASVCGECHIFAEQTLVSPDDLREVAGITKVVIPEHLYTDEVYTKWGDQILPDGTRLPGELFHDESVQKVLKAGGVLHLYRRWVKHPRTMHLPWSASLTDDDRIITSLESLQAGEVVVTEKMDGEQTTFYQDYDHARSVDGAGHPSRSWVKNLRSKIAHDIPTGWRVCGENLYARHSIAYTDLPSWFFVHSIWNERNICLSWDETEEWADLLGLEIVPTLYRGPWDEDAIKACWTEDLWEEKEGYVVRSAGEFAFRYFKANVAKFVRPGHVQTSKHWFFGQAVNINGRAPTPAGASSG